MTRWQVGGSELVACGMGPLGAPLGWAHLEMQRRQAASGRERERERESNKTTSSVCMPPRGRPWRLALDVRS